jgi:hypothetical protein
LSGVKGDFGSGFCLVIFVVNSGFDYIWGAGCANGSGGNAVQRAGYAAAPLSKPLDNAHSAKLLRRHFIFPVLRGPAQIGRL